MKKQRLCERFYYFLVSFIFTMSFLCVPLSMYVSYGNTRALGFGDTQRPVEVYQRDDGKYVLVFGEKSFVIDVKIWRK